MAEKKGELTVGKKTYYLNDYTFEQFCSINKNLTKEQQEDFYVRMSGKLPARKAVKKSENNEVQK